MCDDELNYEHSLFLLSIGKIQLWWIWNVYLGDWWIIFISIIFRHLSFSVLLLYIYVHTY